MVESSDGRVLDHCPCKGPTIRLIRSTVSVQLEQPALKSSPFFLVDTAHARRIRQGQHDEIRRNDKGCYGSLNHFAPLPSTRTIDRKDSMWTGKMGMNLRPRSVESHPATLLSACPVHLVRVVTQLTTVTFSTWARHLGAGQPTFSFFILFATSLLHQPGSPRQRHGACLFTE